MSGCEAFEGSRKYPEIATGRGIARSQSECGGEAQIFGLYVSLRHPVSLGGWGVPACTRVRPTSLYEHQKSKIWNISLLTGYNSNLGLVSRIARPPKSDLV